MVDHTLDRLGSSCQEFPILYSISSSLTGITWDLLALDFILLYNVLLTLLLTFFFPSSRYSSSLSFTALLPAFSCPGQSAAFRFFFITSFISLHCSSVEPRGHAHWHYFFTITSLESLPDFFHLLSISKLFFFKFHFLILTLTLLIPDYNLYQHPLHGMFSAFCMPFQ